jgi:hypothetical protein
MKKQLEITTRFGLRRPNFILDPMTDSERCYAPRTGIAIEKLVEDLRVDLETGQAPKRLFWGPYGGGKTHTLHRMVKNLEEMTKVYPVYVECPDMSKKSTFLELYRDGITRAIGQDFVLGLFTEIVDRARRRRDFLGELQQILGTEELAKAVGRLIDPNFDKMSLWAWFSGVPTGRTILSELGQAQDLTAAEAAYLAGLIVVLGKVLRETRDTTLVLVLDEMERLRDLSADGALTFRTGFTRLTDPNQTYVSLLVGCSAVDLRDMPDVFGGGSIKEMEQNPIISRLGGKEGGAIVEIQALVPQDVDRFVQSIIGYVRDPKANLQKLLDTAKTATTEQVVEDFYPFTREAIEAVKGKPQQITPRDIMIIMTKAAGRAHILGKPIVTADLVLV